MTHSNLPTHAMLLSMITPSHVVYNLVILGKRKQRQVLIAILLGAVFPDVWNFIFFIYEHMIMKVPQEVLWEDMYFHSWWNSVFNLAHSFLLLPILFLIALMRNSRFGTYFFGSALLHAFMDFFVHHKDAYMPFWPLARWKFESPISYWDPLYYGHIFAPIEMTLSLIASYLLYRRAKGKWGKVGASIAMICFFVLGSAMVASNIGFCPSILANILCEMEHGAH